MPPVLPDNFHARDQRIAQRAYEIYAARGAADGGDLDDWLQAEREILAAERPALAEIAVDLEPSLPPVGLDPATIAGKPASREESSARR